MAAKFNHVTGGWEEEEVDPLTGAPQVVPATNPNIVHQNITPPTPVSPPVGRDVPILDNGVPATLANVPQEEPAPPPALAAVPPPAALPLPSARPPGNVLTGVETTSRTAHPELLKAADDLSRVSKEGEGVANAQAGLNAQKANADLQILQNAEKERERLETAAAEDKAKRQEARDKGVAYLQEKTKEYDSYKITDFMEDRTATDRVLLSLAVGLGEFGSKLAGGENTALRIIENNIAADRAKKLGEQKKKLDQRNWAADDLDKKDALLKSADLELRQQVDSFYGKLERKRAAELAKFGADQARIDGDKVVNGLREQRAKNQAEIFKGLETLVSKQYATPAAMGAGAGEGGTRGFVVYGPDGKPIADGLQDKKQAEDATEALKSYRRMDAIANELQGLIEQGWTTPGSDRSSLMKQKKAALVVEMKNLQKLGALDQGTIDISDDIIPSDMGVGRNGIAKIAGFRQLMDRNLVTHFDGVGLNGGAVLGRVRSGPASPQEAPQAQAKPLTAGERARLVRDYQGEKDPAKRAAIARTLRAAGAAN